MLYELATLSCALLEQDSVSDSASRWVSDAKASGTLFGAWRSEIGELAQIIVLRGFEDYQELLQERERTYMNTQPFNIENSQVRLSMEGYALFPFFAERCTGELWKIL